MLKLLKWIYRLAQQTERKRIEGILNDARQASLFTMDYGDSKDRSKVDEKVRQVVANIIDEVANPNRYDQESYSLLYPKGDKNV